MNTVILIIGILLAIILLYYMVSYLIIKLTGRFYISEGMHWYLPILILPANHRNLHMKVKFSTMCWYPDEVPSGWNKLIRIGRLIHYSDYCTMGWQWVNAKDGDKNVYRGRVLKLSPYFHDDWNFPEWDPFHYNFKVDENIYIDIERDDEYTVWTVRQGAFSQSIKLDVVIDGMTMYTPYFGGQGKSYYTHSYKISFKTWKS